MRQSILLTTALVAVGTIVTLYPSANALMRELPLPPQLRDCYLKAQNYTAQNYVGGLYCWYCESPMRAYVKGTPAPFKPVQAEYYQYLYNRLETTFQQHPAGFRGKRQASPAAGQRCLRKEYRTLTDQERNRFHAAVNALKRDTSVEPNKYDALALFHTGMATFVAHGGPGFPGWHRLYLLLFEAALQEADPTVCLPYWDSTMDSALPNPAESYVWSGDFFGDGQVSVTTGPFANWTTVNNVPLRRSVGTDGVLFTRRNIENIMSRNTYEEILLADQDPQYGLEFHHGGAHVFVGGDMERLDTAANDPAFFLHHAFVDYIWELFRNKMRTNGLNPEVYPSSSSINDFHLPTAPMGFGNITHAEGFLDALTEGYQYQSAPECSRDRPDCGSRYLWCDVEQARCVPINPFNPPSPPPASTTPAPVPTPASTPIPLPQPQPQPQPLPGSCTKPKPQAYQNSFCADGHCDVNQWVWLPVKIVSQRPPEFTVYKSYPVQNSQIRTASDIYQSSAYSDTSRYINPHKAKPKAYENCGVKDGVGKIFISSQGLSYDGHYKESAIVDQRLATSIGITYVAVKDPGPTGRTEVLLRAHDQCGRICHSACLIPGSNPPKYRSCSGVVELTSEQPRMYGQTYADATLMTFDYGAEPECPSFNSVDFFVTFYCDYVDHLPWVEKPTQTYPGPAPVHPNNNHVMQPHPGQCQLSSQCTVNKPCYKDPLGQGRTCNKYTEMLGCVGHCGRYVVCNYGTYWLRNCPSGTHFDDKVGTCVRGACQDPTGSGGLAPFPGSSGQTRRPSVVVPSSYYSNIIGRFRVGK